MKKFILCFLMLMAASRLVWAEAISFQATVNSTRVSMDEALQLTLTVTGVNDNLDPVSLPVLDGFTAKYLGPSTSISFVNENGNSESHSERSFIYNLFPNKVGKFQIPSISATISGQTYTTKPIDVEVVDGSAATPPASSSSTDQDQTPSVNTLKDKVLVTVSLDKTEAYLNERVPVTVKLLVADVPVRDIQYPQFDKTGLAVDEFEKPEQSSEVIDGVKYDTVEFKTYIYPTHLGDLQVGPVQIQGNVLYKTGEQNPFNQDNDFFGGNVFNNFFESYATRPITVSSKPVQLHVSDLPEENRPDNFTGAIGQFDFQASVAPLKVKAGDPLTLKMDVKGSGNFKSLKMPVFQAPGFKTYEPQIKNLGDEKTDELVIIPTSAAVRQIPTISFSYFDTSIKDYKTITQGPFDIQVTAPSADQEFKAVGFADVSKEALVLPANPFSAVAIINKIIHFLGILFRSLWFWISVGIVFLAGIAYFIWRRFQERLENDPAFARRLKAVREARKTLSPAEGFITSGKTKDFYALVSKVLRDYLANKWHQPSAALNTEQILNRLKTAKIGEANIAKIKTLLEEADLVCFAGSSVDPHKMRADLSQVQELIAYLEKSLK